MRTVKIVESMTGYGVYPFEGYEYAGRFARFIKPLDDSMALLEDPINPGRDIIALAREWEETKTPARLALEALACRLSNK